MFVQIMKNYQSMANLRQKQTNNIIFITFWSQFSVYALNTVLILFLTKPFLEQGLGYSQIQAYAFVGITQAANYLMPVMGGFMADNVLGIRRSILLGSIFLATAYLLVMLSGYSVPQFGDKLFIAAYALIPATNSLLMGTSSSMISYIYNDDAIKAKSAMTFYYMAINVGALLATIIAPELLESAYGPLSVLTISFIGKSIAALNFARKYHLYDNAIYGKDTLTANPIMMCKLAAYLLGIYLFTLFAFSHINLASIIISGGCAFAFIWFFIKTTKLPEIKRRKQFIALVLIIEALIFFIIYNQMNSTLVLFAKYNSDLHLFGLTISPAQYQILNPLLIMVLGTQLPRFYRRLPWFNIPYQFAAGTILAGIALLLMNYASATANNGLVNGNFIALTYVLITLAELWVSAIGLSMIGLYCDTNALAFAMGVWYLTTSMSNVISGKLAAIVALKEPIVPSKSLVIFQKYYCQFGMFAVTLGIIMLIVAYLITTRMARGNISLP